MDNLAKVKKLLAEILDVEETDIHPTTSLVQELDVESIDLLEIAVVLGNRFDIAVVDDVVFLKEMRSLLQGVEQNTAARCAVLLSHYPHLTGARVEEMLRELSAGPVLQVQDLLSYVEYQRAAAL